LKNFAHDVRIIAAEDSAYFKMNLGGHGFCGCSDDAMDVKDRIIIALDVPDAAGARKLIDTLGDAAVYYKVGLELYTAAGEEVLDMLRAAGRKFFLDLKLFDIPNTVKRAASSIAEKGAALTTIHTLGGLEMMKAAVQGVASAGDKAPAVLGVTILTSLDEDTLRNDLKIEKSIPSMVRFLAENAKAAGLNGVVASPLELSLLREHLDESFLIVTPGIRPAWSAANDQKRIMTPRDAFERGASYIVIGRPVTAAEDPAEALRKIHDEIAGS